MSHGLEVPTLSPHVGFDRQPATAAPAPGLWASTPDRAICSAYPEATESRHELRDSDPRPAAARSAFVSGTTSASAAVSRDRPLLLRGAGAGAGAAVVVVVACVVGVDVVVGSVVLGLLSPAPALGADAGLEAAPDVSADEVAAPVPLLGEVGWGSDAEPAPPSTPPSTESARPPTTAGEPRGDTADDPAVEAGEPPASAGADSVTEATAGPCAGAGVSGAGAAVSQGVAGA